MEYFSNVAHQGINTQNQNLYNRVYGPLNFSDVTLLQYHTSRNPDPIYAQNNDDNNARMGYYNNEVNAEIHVNGGAGAGLYSGSVANLNQWDLDSLMLQEPAFNIQISPLEITNGQIRLQAEIQATRDLPSANYAVYAVVVEDSVQHGLINNRAVMRKMLPNHADLRYDQDFERMEIINIDQTWSPSASAMTTMDTAKIYALVFIQDYVSKEVFQVNTTRNINLATLPTGSMPSESETAKTPEVFAVRLYPNPAIQQCRADWPEPLDAPYQWQLYDALGRSVDGGQLPIGSTGFEIQTTDLAQGLYYLRLHNAEASVFVQRQIIVIK